MTILLENLKNGIVEVNFIKADGALRTMKATTCAESIDYKFEQPLNSAITSPTNLIRVWDIEIMAWRSIRYDRIIDSKLLGIS